MLERIIDWSRTALHASPPSPIGGTDTSRNRRILLVNAVWLGMWEGPMVVYLPVFLARLGASPTTAGLLVSIPALVSVLLCIPGGAYVQRHSALVRLAFRIGLIISFSQLLIGLIPFWVGPGAATMAVIVLWSLIHVARAIFWPTWTTVIDKAIPPQGRAQFLGNRWALMQIAWAVSIAVFGYVSDLVPFPRGYQVVFLSTFVACIVNFWVYSRLEVPLFIPPRVNQEPGAGLRARLSAFLRPFIENRPFLYLGVATFAYRLILSLSVALYSLYWVNDLQGTDTWIGLVGTMGSVSQVAGYVFWGRMTNRMDHREILIVCGAILGLYPLLTGLATTMQWLLPAAAIYGFSLSGLEISLLAMLLVLSPEGRQPSFAGVINMVTGATSAIGPVIGAALAQNLTVRAALLIVGGVQIASAAVFFLLPRRAQETM